METSHRTCKPAKVYYLLIEQTTAKLWIGFSSCSWGFGEVRGGGEEITERSGWFKFNLYTIGEIDRVEVRRSFRLLPFLSLYFPPNLPASAHFPHFFTTPHLIILSFIASKVSILVSHHIVGARIWNLADSTRVRCPIKPLVLDEPSWIAN